MLSTALDCPRRSSYYQSVPTSGAALLTAIKQIVIRYPRYGYRRITAQLRRDGWTVNSKVVRRLMRELGRPRRMRQVRLHITNSMHVWRRFPNLARALIVSCPDVPWVVHITCIRLRSGFIFLAVILEVFTRSVRGGMSAAA